MSNNLNFLNPETLAKAEAQRRDAQGLVTVIDHIRKAHAQGPTQGDPLAKRTKVQPDDGDLDAATKAIRKIHHAGARVEDPDFAKMTASTPMRYRDNRPSFKAIREAQSNPLTMEKLFAQGNGNHPINMRDVERIVERGRRELRKTAGLSGADWNRMSWPERLAAMGKGPAVPPQSSNAQWSRQVADTGASNATLNRDQPVPSQPFSTTMGGFTDSAISPSDARIRAAVAMGSNRDASVTAIKEDWKRRKLQMAQDFANRPAARTMTSDIY